MLSIRVHIFITTSKAPGAMFLILRHLFTWDMAKLKRGIGKAGREHVFQCFINKARCLGCINSWNPAAFSGSSLSLRHSFITYDWSRLNHASIVRRTPKLLMSFFMRSTTYPARNRWGLWELWANLYSFSTFPSWSSFLKKTLGMLIGIRDDDVSFRVKTTHPPQYFFSIHLRPTITHRTTWKPLLKVFLHMAHFMPSRAPFSSHPSPWLARECH